MKVLEDLKTNLMQGYLFSKPCDKNQFQQLYIENNVPEYCQRIHPTEVDEVHEGLQEALSNTEYLETIMGAMEDVVYVSDVDTYELYYLNPAGCSMTGAYITKERNVILFCREETLHVNFVIINAYSETILKYGKTKMFI